ncbi:MAG: hypothetical protein H7Y18_07565 [Clostridiaceae bacterium]|nr:hypothetical protein [Clostridiaceae bacterium]
MNESRQRVIDHLKASRDGLSSKEVTIGIDAFVDKIVRVVENKPSNGDYVFFKDIAQFGKHIVSKSGKSCGIEINESFTKLGGNAPIMAHSLGSLSVRVNCVGALGYPQIDPIFNDLSSNCNLYTIGNPGYTTALEFEDGKIMLSQRDYLHRIDWNAVKNMLGIDKIRNFFNESNLLGMVNWNGMIHFNNIFKGILEELMPEHNANKDQILFFDLADVSERTTEDICEALALINEFAKHYKVILGLNENETILLYKALYPEKEIGDWISIGQFIYDNLDIDALVVHTLTNSMAWEKKGTSQVESLFVKKPKLSTGGGDNFNAGLCFGQLIGLDFEGSLYCANGTSGYYVRNAESPTIDNLIETLEQWEELIQTP